MNPPFKPKPLAQAAHARLSPSGAKGWFACAGRLAMEDAYPNLPNVHSDEGTACHAVAAWCLTEHYRASHRIGQWITVSHPDEEIERKVCFTEEMADWTQSYVDHVRYTAIGCDRLLVEQRLPFGKFVATEDCFGTTDAAILDYGRGEIVIEDAKFGYVEVDVHRNKQLMIYALAMLGALYEEHMAKLALRQAAEAAKENDDDLS